MNSARRWLLPSYGTILALAALSVALFPGGPGMFARDGDGARHTRVGHVILETGGVPKADIFSHTKPGEPIVLHEWLSEVALATADTLAGLPGIAVLASLLFTIGVLGIYRTADELGAPRPLALAAGVLGLFLEAVHLLPRPHLFTTAFAAVFLIVLVRFARSGRAWALAPLPLLMPVWANTHGGFLLGVTLLVAFLIGALLESPEFSTGRRAARPLAIVLVLCLVGTLLTPAGTRLWTYTTGHLGGDDFLLAVTQEFQSVDFHQGYARLFLIALLAGPALWMTGRVRVTWLGAGLYLFFASSALYAARNVALFGLIVLPWTAMWATQALEGGGEAAKRVLARLREMDRGDRTLRPWAWSVAWIGLIAVALGPASDRYHFDRHRFPVEAVSHFDEIDTSGPVFNQLRWGGYLLYERPDVPVFIDGQTDFYGEALAREYIAALQGQPEWREVLDRYGVQWTLTGPRQPLVQLLELDPGWYREYADSTAVIYRRRAD
ncbi:MAG: hypothetical protein PVF05_04750 [Gemmatimonadales bacterium]|jgi:hypothetical protein